MSSGGTGTGTNGVFSPFFDLIDGAATTIQREFRQRRARLPICRRNREI